MPPHCDTMDGPNCKNSQKSFRSRRVNIILLYRPPSMMETVERQLANLKDSSELITKEK